jgi:undecaprenyl-diphosphatase
MSVHTLFLRVDQVERRLCLFANAAARRHVVRTLFQTVSRLGDGVFWYALMAFLPFAFGVDGLLTAAQMLAAGLVGLALYKVLKHSLVRERPFIGLLGIECAMPPLDRYSFPSGHTLHAVLFTSIAVAHFPALGLILVPFALLVAASRVILGLHYPTDVAAGAALGGFLAALSEYLR